jgi:glycosyltransferase involved in cell wall biosynthesis
MCLLLFLYPMDIAFVWPFLDCLGGAEKFGLELMRRLCETHKLTVYAFSIDESLLREYGVEANTVVCRPYLPFSRRNTLCLMASVFFMRRQIKGHELYFLNLFPTHIVDVHPNVWIAHEPSRMLYDLCVFDDLSLPMRVFKRLYVSFLRFLDGKLMRADRVVANSRYSASYLRQVYGVESRVAYPGVEACGLPRFGGDYVLAVGRLSFEKRIGLAVDAMKYLPDLRLKVVGVGPDLEALRRSSADNVDFLGRVSDKELKSLYSNALCTVFTALREPFGMVCLESLSCGTPVVGCLDGGFTEVLEDGVDCFLVEPTPQKIAEKIRELKDNPGLTEKMGSAGYEKSKKHTWEKTLNEIMEYALR